MAQIGYNETVMDHFMNPRNVGVIENPDGSRERIESRDIGLDFVGDEQQTDLQDRR